MSLRFQEVSKADMIDDISISSFESQKKSVRFGLYRYVGKRSFDVFLVLVTMPLVLPVILPLVLLVAIDGGRPFYCQNRIGQNGKHYRMWKIRSMVLNADEKLQHYIDNNYEIRMEWEKTQKLKNDPRITKIGRLLRKSSLDELPQLWNVLKGDMSLVGPRPMMVDQRKLYPGFDYFELKPGITGLWQVSARNESAFSERARFDAEYNRRMSFFQDVCLILATFRVVFRGTGH